MTGSRALAVAQTCPVTGDVSANIEEHIALTHVAAAERAQILVFPDLSLTGYEMDLGQALAFSEDDQRLEALRLVAVSCSVIAMAGAPVRIGSQVHIGAFVLAPERTTSLYTKHRLGAFPESARCDDGGIRELRECDRRSGDRRVQQHLVFSRRLLVRLPPSGSGVAVVHDTPDGPRATTWVRSRF
jgi:hypothetical protein